MKKPELTFRNAIVFTILLTVGTWSLIAFGLVMLVDWLAKP